MIAARVLALLLCAICVQAFTQRASIPPAPALAKTSLKQRSSFLIQMVSSEDDLDETVRKSGLEVGIWKAFTSKNKEGGGPTAKDLLSKYGGAYLITSITLAIISYALCYLLISRGVDVSSLLEKINIRVSSTSSSAGTAALAYAVHKAASPIRFPPTVALTPVVAGWLGEKTQDGAKKKD